MKSIGHSFPPNDFRLRNSLKIIGRKTRSTILSKRDSHKKGLRPAPVADKATLIRRVTLDLTGLPPTLAEIDDFLNDDSPRAYEKVVDRLLKSHRYGEHMARYWLDAARYADTNGFFQDSERSMWRWREWVIKAFNNNLPFDQFTIEQLAGDMLPNASLDQKIATGFNRNHMTTRESGAIDEEYRVEYVVDRVKTTSIVWLGLTLECARCHDHKYDPISQEEFYRFFAFFNNVPEAGLKTVVGNSAPFLQLPDQNFEAEKSKLQALQTALVAKCEALQPEILAAQTEWEQSATGNLSENSAEGLFAALSNSTAR